VSIMNLRFGKELSVI